MHSLRRGTLAIAIVGLLWVMVAATEQPSQASCGTAAGALTAGNPGIGYTQLPGGWVQVGATIDPTYTGGAYQPYYNNGYSYAELGATPGYPNYIGGLIAKALGLPTGKYGLPPGFALLIRPAGSNSPGIRILKSDIGSGQASELHYVIDLHPAIAQAIAFDGKQDVEIKAAGNSPGVGGAGASALAAACASVSPGSYVNPFRNSTSIAGNRIDMGVDYDGTGPIEALGDAQVTFAQTGIGGNWTCSNSTNGGVIYQLLDGPYKGKYVYIAEDITPTQAATTSLATHQPVPAGTPIAQFTGSAPCIEMGWSASPTNVYPLAETLPGFAGDVQSSQAIAAGDSMNRLVVALHGPAGHQEGAGASVTPATMPTGYP